MSFNDDAKRRHAEAEWSKLYDRSNDQPVSVPFRTKRKIPGGNMDLPVRCILEAPNDDFWAEDMPSYILSILDETVTNGYRWNFRTLELLSDESELGIRRLALAKLGLMMAGAIEIE